MVIPLLLALYAHRLAAGPACQDSGVVRAQEEVVSGNSCETQALSIGEIDIISVWLVLLQVQTMDVVETHTMPCVGSAIAS